MRIIRAFWNGTRAATSIEYALIAGFVSIAIVAGATTIGSNLNSKYFAVLAAKTS